MALIVCSVCGASISEHAQNCPKCGAPTQPRAPQQPPQPPLPPPVYGQPGAQQPPYQQPGAPVPAYQQPTNQVYINVQQPVQDPNADPRGPAPENVGRWNWGAFTFGWIWGVFNGVYWPLLGLIPYVGWFAAMFVFPFILGATGNRMSWKNRSRWSNAATFRGNQRGWGIAAGIWWLLVLMCIIGGILFLVSSAASLSSLFY